MRTFGVVPLFPAARTDPVSGEGVPLVPAAGLADPKDVWRGAEVTSGACDCHFEIALGSNLAVTSRLFRNCEIRFVIQIQGLDEGIQ